MKKFVALLTAICLSVTPMTIFAYDTESVLKDIPEIEDFSLHSGTVFGDSISDVKKKEQEAGFSVHEENSKDGKHSIFYKGKFANINDSYLLYRFDKTGKVYNTRYSFGDIENFDGQSKNFATIASELKKKYGDPLFDEGEGIPFVLLEYNDSNSITGWACYYSRRQIFSSDEVEIYNCNQWLFKLDDYYLLIDHSLVGTDMLGWTYAHELSYTYLDEQTVIDTLNSYNDSQDEIANSFNDDL